MSHFRNRKIKKPVLIIEDDEIQLKLLASLLEIEDLQPICCRTGKEAIAACRRQAANVAILDLQLPDTDGLAILKQLKELNPHIKVIINTGYPSLETAMAAVNEEAFAYVKKSGEVEELLTHIHRAFHEHLADYSELLETEVKRRTEELLKANAELRNEISERKRAEAALAQRAHEMEGLYETWLEINAQSDNSTLLEAIVQRASHLLGTPMGGLFLLKSDSETLELVVGHNHPNQFIGRSLRLGEGLAGRIAQSGEPMIVNEYREWEGRAEILSGAHVGRILGAPLTLGDRVIGVLTVFDEQIGTFTDDEVQLLSLFAAQAATAIEKSRLFEETHRHAQQLAILNKLAREMTGLLEMNKLCTTVVERICLNFDYINVSIFILEPEANELVLAAIAGIYSDRFRPGEYRQHLAEGIIGQAAATGEIILIDEARQHPDFYTLPGMELNFELAIPLKVGEGVIGVLVISSEKHTKLENSDIAALSTLADQLAVAMEKARLFEAEREQRELAEALREVGADLSATLDFNAVLDRLLDQIDRVVPYDAANVALIEGKRSRVVRMRGYEQFGSIVANEMAALSFEIPKTANLQQMAETKQPLVISDTTADPEWVPVAATAHIRSWAGAPIMGHQGQVIAFFSLDQVEPDFYKPEHARRLAAFAGQAGIALENARLHQEARRQARQVQQILDTAPEGILLLNSEHCIELANPAAQTYLAFLGAGKVGDILTQLGQRPLLEILTPLEDNYWHEITAVDSPEIIFEVAAQAMKLGLDTEGWVMVLRDVTEERAVQKRIQQQERLAAVGQLAAGIAHDFNNILTSIIGYAELICLEPHLSDLTRDDVNLIVQQGERAAHLIRQILDFSRKSIIAKRSVDLAAFLAEIVRLLKRTIPEDIRIALEIDPGPEETYSFKADQTQLQQALTNLALNARDAMPHGGQLTFRLAQFEFIPGERPPCPEMPPGHWFSISLADTGIGISSEHLPYLFEPFFTTKEVGEGTGLGLAQVYGIVKQHDGYIDVESQEAVGTTFTLYLPSSPLPSGNQPELASTTVPRGNGQVILLVEDDNKVLEVTKTMLERLDYQVLIATNGREALDVFEQNQDSIALVLTDVTMPELGGLALAEALLERDKGIKVVALTGYPLDRKAKTLLSQGIVDWLQKPLRYSQLADVVSRFMNPAGRS
ncbi:MAG TPA: GAF domain-containing protein [Anaerolineae bacterium]